MTPRRAWAAIAVLTIGALFAACTSSDADDSAARTLQRAVEKTLHQPSFRVEQHDDGATAPTIREYQMPNRQRDSWDECGGRRSVVIVGPALYASIGTTPETYRVVPSPNGKPYATGADELEWFTHGAVDVREIEPGTVEFTLARQLRRRFGGEHVLARVRIRGGLVRELALRTEGASRPMGTLRYRDFGQVPPIEPPPPEQVVQTGPTVLCTNPDLDGAQLLPDGSALVGGTGATPP